MYLNSMRPLLALVKVGYPGRTDYGVQQQTTILSRLVAGNHRCARHGYHRRAASVDSQRYRQISVSRLTTIISSRTLINSGLYIEHEEAVTAVPRPITKLSLGRPHLNPFQLLCHISQAQMALSGWCDDIN
jgi:hypothetical protein